MSFPKNSAFHYEPSNEPDPDKVKPGPFPPVGFPRPDARTANVEDLVYRLDRIIGLLEGPPSAGNMRIAREEAQSIRDELYQGLR